MELNGCRVLVTGGAGFIGSHLADRLLDIGCNVTVLDSFDKFYDGKKLNIAHHQGNGRYTLLEGDILDWNTLQPAMENIDVVFHEAAQAGIRKCNQEPMKAHQTNVTGTLNVLTAARENGVKRIVYASSSSVYGEPVYLPLNEDHPTNPTSPYGVSKLSAEKYCLAFHNVYGVDVVCLRYFSVYGPRGRPDQVLYRFAESVSAGKAPIIFGDGCQTRDFTYISDVVEATVLAAESEYGNGKVLNIGFGGEVSINKAAGEIIRRFHRDVEPSYGEVSPGDFPHTHADIELAHKLLGWKPKIGFEEGLDSFIEWFKDRLGR